MIAYANLYTTFYKKHISSIDMLNKEKFKYTQMYPNRYILLYNFQTVYWVYQTFNSMQLYVQVTSSSHNKCFCGHVCHTSCHIIGTATAWHVYKFYEDIYMQKEQETKKFDTRTHGRRFDSMIHTITKQHLGKLFCVPGREKVCFRVLSALKRIQLVVFCYSHYSPSNRLL